MATEPPACYTLAVRGSTCQTDLSAYLTARFDQLELVDEEVGYSLWCGESQGRKVAVHCVPDWSLQATDKEALVSRLKILEEAELRGLPKLLEVCLEADHQISIQAWVEHDSWDQAVLTRETALSLGVELFALLAELHARDWLHGSVSSSYLGLGRQDGRLYLFPPVSLPEQEATPEIELARALELFDEFLTEDERKQLCHLRSGHEIARRLGRLLSQVGPEQAEPDLVGRDEALRKLDLAIVEGGTITVEAPAGGGKTRLLKEWSETLEARVLLGKASREVAPSPFRIFQNAFSWLEQECGKRPELARRLSALYGSDGSIRSALSRHSYNQRSSLVWLAGLLEVLVEDRPTVLILEDVHWADPFTLEFARYWSSEPRRALLILSCRSDEVPRDHPFHQLDCSRVALPPLSDEQAERVLRSIQPGASQVLVESAVRRARGNPFLLFQFLRSGTTEGDLYKARVSSLSQKTKQTLAVAAILGDKVQESIVARCLEGEPCFTEGLDMGLVSRSGSDYRFTHDRFREACLAELSSQESTDVHLRAALYFAERDRPEAFLVAYHFHMAGKPEMGLEFALDAAAVARREHDLSTAIYYYQAALAGLDESDARRSEVLFQLGDSFRLVGRYAESEQRFLQALSYLKSSHERAEVGYALGDVYFKQAKLNDARDVLMAALKSLGESPPLWLHGSFVRQAIELMVGSADGGAPQARETDLLKARLYNRLAYVGWFLEGPVASIWAHFCEFNIARKHGESVELARAMANHAMAMSAVPLWPRAVEFGRRALETARRIGDQWCEGAAGHLYGAVLLGACKLKEARDVLLEAREKLRQAGDRWEENGICYHLALVYYRLGALEQAAKLALQTHQVGVEIGDRLAAGDNLNTLARARQGDFPKELMEKEKRYLSPDVQRACELLCSEAIWKIRRRDYGDAVSLLQEARERYRAKGVHNMYSAVIPCWLTTALRLQLQTTLQNSRSRLWPALRQALKDALKQARRYQTNLPHVLREKALVDILEGDHRSAYLALKESAEFARRQEMRYEYKLSCQIWRRFTWALGALEVEASPLHESEYDWLLGGEKSTANSDRWSELLEAATRISHCLSAPTALHQLYHGCRQALSPDVQCSIVQLAGDGTWRELVGDLSGVVPPQPFSQGGWSDLAIPGFEGRTRLLVRDAEQTLREQDACFVEFLTTVTGAVIERATRTISSTVLSRDLQRSTDQLNEEAAQLCKAKEQLLLSERLALTGRLAAGLVHDLRNLILGINGSVEVLAMDQQGATEELHRILEAGKKSNQLLDRLNGLCRGKVLGPQVVELNERVSDSVPLLRSLCGPLIELEFHLTQAGLVEIDPLLLDRILLNLVMNARDAVGRVGEVWVRTEETRLTEKSQSLPHQVPPGHYSVLSVSDNGTGIAKDILPKIFDLHFTTKSGVGTGVGLATVQEMVMESKGFITVESDEKGATFKVYLPSKSGRGSFEPGVSIRIL